MTRPERVSMPAADAGALTRDLASVGFDCAVETRAAMALLIMQPADLDRMCDAETRRSIQRLARARGFTHCAVELGVATPAQRADAQRPDAPLHD